MTDSEIDDDVKTEFGDELTDEALDRVETVENSVMPYNRCRCAT
jgi:hypothetical protein